MTMTPPPPITTRGKSGFSDQVSAFITWLSGTFIDELDTVTGAFNFNSTNDSSSTSNAIGTGAKTFTVSAGKSFLGGMYLIIADTAAPSTNSMFCQVTSYSGTTLVVNVLSVLGSGTKTAWTISQSAFSAGQVLKSDFQNQTYTAATTGGTGTAFTITPTPPITAYAAPQEWDVVFSAACGAAPTFQVSGLASPPNLVKQNADGTYSNLAAGNFPSGWASKVKMVSPTQALVRSLPPADASATVKGIIELATDAEAQALSSALLAITPASLKGALQGANQSLAASGYQKLPGGLIIQWGTTASVANGVNSSATFPIAFPTGVLSVATQVQNNSGTASYACGIGALTTTTLTISNLSSVTNQWRYIAIGY